MKVYIDRCTDEDHISDAFEFEEIFEGAIFKTKCKWGRYSANEDVQLAGSNPSAEDCDEGGEDDSKVRMIDIVHHFKQAECTFMDKKCFKDWLSDKDNLARWKGYHKDHVLEENSKASEEEIDQKFKDWKVQLMSFAKFILPKWKSVIVFQDVKEDIEGAKCFYVGDEEGDHMYYIAHLYRCEKC